MRRPMLVIAALAGCLPAAPGLAVPGGEIGTMPTGTYRCELPGDAGGPWRVRQPDEDFEIIGASVYRSNGIRGSYLLTDGHLAITSGPLKGKHYERQSHGFLRLIGDDGKPGELRCVLTGGGAR